MPVSCGAVTPTVTNIGAISIIGGAFHTVVIHNADAFAPGAVPQDGSDDPTGSDEIEIFVNLNDENSSSLIVDTGDDGDAFVFGSGGVNTNVLGEACPGDADIMGIGTAGSLAGFGGNASDSLNAGGGLGTGVRPERADHFGRPWRRRQRRRRRGRRLDHRGGRNEPHPRRRGRERLDQPGAAG